MSSQEFERKAVEADRLLNDPDLPFDPTKVWALMEEMARSPFDPGDELQALGAPSPETL